METLIKKESDNKKIVINYKANPEYVKIRQKMDIMKQIKNQNPEQNKLLQNLILSIIKTPRVIKNETKPKLIHYNRYADD
jgi:hypothetical protein